MQPLKIIIPGRYWDTQIYSGKLYLFGISGNVLTLNWDRLITEWSIEEELALAMKCAFSQSALLYGEGSKPFVEDIEIKQIIQNKFERLGEMNFEVSPSQLSRYTNAQQDTPFPFPHTDTCIYKQTMYATSHQGVFSASCHGKTKFPISTKAEKKWDAPVLSVAASYGNLALAAGSEGLFDLPLDWWENREEPERLAKGNFTGCNRLYFSIYGSSHVSGGVLIDYDKKYFERGRQNDDSYSHEEKMPRGIKRSEESIFHTKGYSWGNHDKIYLATNNEIRIVKYNPWTKSKSEKERITHLRTINLELWKGGVVSASTSLFGTVIECDNALVILPTEGAGFTIPGEPVNWRVFPRSKFYENHLHVIRDNYVEIYSFNHDYFVDQDSKLYGIKRPSDFRNRNRYSNSINYI